MDYDPFSDEVLDDPHRVYARLRAESPVHYLEAFDTWALALFEDVWNAGAETAHFVQPGPVIELAGVREGQLLAEAQAEVLESGASIFIMNPPQHTQLRKRLARLFSPQGVARLEPGLRALVCERLDAVLPTGRCDVIGDFAAQIAVQATCLLIGLPVGDGPALVETVRRFFAREPGFAGMPPDGIAASLELREYLWQAVRTRRKRADRHDDAMQAYLDFELEGRPLTDEEVAMHLMTLVTGGTETLPKVFAGGVLQLYRHPEQRAELAADPSLLPSAFTEIARTEMPTNFLTRTVAKDLVLRDRQLRAGQGVMLLYRSANRDEREFPEPDRFDIHRRAARTLSFGHGTHVCLGQHVARLEARIMLEELLRRVPDYAVLEDEVVPARSEFVAGYLAMPIAFGGDPAL
ncbi:MAG: cytochrome P450 [Myxococcales bacterium]|nr:MAG: cytochrome P450 [Myxococcales bacterium]